MKAFEELVEEVYQDSDLRQEFIRYAQLKVKGKQRVRQMKENTPPARANVHTFVTYQEISQTKPELSLEVIEWQWGLLFLSSALFKTLSLRYQLSAEEVQRLREAVTARYEQQFDS